jgi:hypothetical protein
MMTPLSRCAFSKSGMKLKLHEHSDSLVRTDRSASRSIITLSEFPCPFWFVHMGGQVSAHLGGGTEDARKLPPGTEGEASVAQMSPSGPWIELHAGALNSTHKGKWSEIRHESWRLVSAGTTPFAKLNITALAY